MDSNVRTGSIPVRSTISKNHMSQKSLAFASHEPAMQSYVASCIDIACKPLVINQSWLYDRHLNTSMMKEKLAELLSEYPTMAGRISGDCIVCNNAGALWEVNRQPDISVAELPKHTIPEKKFLAEFDYKSALAGSFPLLSIKVTLLKDGTILNVKCSHLCADGSTFYRMVENWSSLTRNEGIVSKPLYDDTAVRKVLKASKVYGELDLHDMKETGNIMEKEGMYRIKPTVMFSMMLQKLLRIDRRLSSPVFVPYSTITAVKDTSGQAVGRNAALSAIAVDILKRPMDWTGKDINIVHTADHRGRIDFIGMDYTGNVSFTLRPTTVNADLPAGQMALLIEEDMKRMLKPESESRYFAFYYTMLEKKMPYLPFNINSMWCTHPTTFIINNCLRFKIYGMDFGEGSPVFAWPLDFSDPVRFWPAPPQEDGVYIYFTGNFVK